MKPRLSIAIVCLAALFCVLTPAFARGDDFSAVVRTVEQFYHVKHQTIPLLARAGIKTATTAARIRGGDARRLAEAGSVKFAYFEEQDFNPHGQLINFKHAVDQILADWTPFVQTTASAEHEVTYIYLRDAGSHFNVMVVAIEGRDATVVQVNLAPKVLASLLQDPENMGKAIVDDAARDQPE
jgi:hypothetical protein